MDYEWVEDKLDEVYERLNRLEAMIPKSVSASSGVEHKNNGDDMATKSEMQAADYRAEAKSGIRTERVVLEVKHFSTLHAIEWGWGVFAQPVLRPGESVRVVEETHFDDLAQVAMQRDALIREHAEESLALREMWRLSREACYERAAERDAAIRERDKLRAARITQSLTADRFASAVAEADTLRARVDDLESQLESVACRAATAETALEARTSTPGEGSCAAQAASGNSQAILDGSQAASGVGEGEQDCWAVENNEGGVVAAFTIEQAAELYAKTSDRGGPYTVVPRYAAPPQPRGWLSKDEREAVEYFSRFCDEHVVPDQWNAMSARLRNLLARSSPPEVVLPEPPFHPNNIAYGDWMMCLSAVKDALAAAGVAVKEVG
jgi:hypothetical protein